MTGNDARSITLFFSGDVMTGRGIDQALPQPGVPRLCEPWIKDARDYVRLAEAANGRIHTPVSYSYIWGDALDVLEKTSPDSRIINLETSITAGGDCWAGKSVHYRMNPANSPSLKIAGIDLCVLANNHVLDWGYTGLHETLGALKKEKIRYAGAGLNSREAGAPGILEVSGKGRVVVFSFGSPSSGIPFEWAASENRPGINLLEEFSGEAIYDIEQKVKSVKQKKDILVFSIHWGGNWGYSIPRNQTEFAHNLIDRAQVDIVYGHSSHHVKAIEVYGKKLILYGCGDFLDDYEGISGSEEFRADLGLMYFVQVDPISGDLTRLEMVPTRTRNFRVNRATKADTLWLTNALNRECLSFGTRVQSRDDDVLTLKWG